MPCATRDDCASGWRGAGRGDGSAVLSIPSAGDPRAGMLGPTKGRTVMTEHEQDRHPSQAEGEDPQAQPTGEDAPQTGHPSQAEGEDPAAPADGDDVGDDA